MARAFVSVGSNINPGENVRRAVRLLARQVRVQGISTVYLTEPVEQQHEQEPYYNCVLETETDRSPLELKQNVLRLIEEELGRKRSADKFAPRTIDLDLILYDDLVIKEEGLTLPDPEILKRPFLSIPLCELAPELVLPDTRIPIAEVAARFRHHTMKPLEAYTDRLRGEIRHGFEQ